MKPYYHAHESAYKELKEKGYVGWGKVQNLNELGDEKTKSYLREVIKNHLPETKSKTALDIGCGTGTTAFELAKLGFNVTGVDISATAVEMAKEHSVQLRLKINFLVEDILHFRHINEKFDFIYDSHCLHCIVFENDRRQVLSNIKNRLRPGAIFVLDTMVLPKERIDPTAAVATLRFDENYILWHKTNASDGYGIIEHGGENWCAQRRIYPPETILAEVVEAGFKIVSQQIDPSPQSMSMLRLVLKA